MQNLFSYIFIYPVVTIELAALLILSGGKRICPFWLWLISAAGLVVSILRGICFLDSPGWGRDHAIFYSVGSDIWASENPYSTQRWPSHPFLNPPTAFPYFAIIAALPLEASMILWLLLDSLMLYGLIFLSHRILFHDSISLKQSRSNCAELALLASSLSLSDAAMASLQLGQLAIREAFLLLLAFHAKQIAKPILAGVLLGIATMKIVTMLPFLLLFCSKKDLRSWLALGLTTFTLLLIDGQPENTIDQMYAILSQVEAFSQPGAVNDVTYQGPYNEWILGIEHLAYRCGFRERANRKAIEAISLFAIASLLIVRIATRKLSTGLGIALVSLFSTIFLYHRLYDTIILAPAILLSFENAKRRIGKVRWIYVITLCLLFAVIFMRRKTLTYLTMSLQNHTGFARFLLESLILPYATWFILLSMVLLIIGEHLGDCEKLAERDPAIA